MATHRLRGRMPIDAKTLRWYYGLVIDPYALVVHRADGRIGIEEIAGGAWSGTIDLAGQFRRASPLPGPIASAMLIFAVLIVPPIAWLWRIRR